MHAAAADLALAFDPFAPDQLEDPYPFYARARREAPVFHSPRFGMWVVTRYADIAAIQRDTTRFSSAGSLEAGQLPAPVREVLSAGYTTFASLVQSDPPDHTRVRGVLGKALSPTRVAGMEAAIRRLAGELIDAFVGDGQAELVGQLAFLLPGLVICDLLGVPRADMQQLRRWTDDKGALMTGHDPAPRLVEAAHGFVACQRYFQAHIEARAARPGDDLLTLLVPESIGGTAPLDMQEAVCNAMDLLAAGHQTTTDLIGNAIALLIDRPDDLRALRDDPGLLPRAIEEFLRIEAPVRGFFRTTREDVEVAGVVIPKDAKVLLLYGSGNRDEAQFPDPDRLDIRRKDADKHLAFGRGIHFCIGSFLGRLEGAVALELLLRRLPNLRRAEGKAHRRNPYLINRGYDEFHIAWDV